MRYCLGIEIGGTKLQIGMGDGAQAQFAAFHRDEVDATQGAAEIRRRIVSGCRQLLGDNRIPLEQIAGIGVSFGGPVDADAGRTIISHQVAGWENFPLAEWLSQELDLPVCLQNDADSAALAEAHFGAGRGFNPVLYVTVGSGMGGGLIIGGRIFRGSGAGAMEIGHLRPGRLPRSLPHGGNTVEAIASGFGITERARREIADWRDTLDYVRSQFAGKSPHETELAPAFQQRFDPRAERFSRLLELADGDPSRINTRLISRAAEAGDRLSLELLADATWAIGWALAQAIALVNPACIVIGGGVSLIGEELFFEPVRRACRQQCFEPFAGIAEIVPAALGEEVVVYGALAVAAQAFLKDA